MPCQVEAHEKVVVLPIKILPNLLRPPPSPEEETILLGVVEVEPSPMDGCVMSSTCLVTNEDSNSFISILRSLPTAVSTPNRRYS